MQTDADPVNKVEILWVARKDKQYIEGRLFFFSEGKRSQLCTVPWLDDIVKKGGIPSRSPADPMPIECHHC